MKPALLVAATITDMTPAEARTLRETLGLTYEWIAQRHKVARPTVVRWENGYSGLPDTYRSFLYGLLSDAETTAADITEDLQIFPPGERRYTVPQTGDRDGYPATYWRAIAARIRHELPDLIIEYGG